MAHKRSLSAITLTVVAFAYLSIGDAAPPSGAPARPSLEPVAETKLLMEGMNMSNFRGMERHLRKKPEDRETWVFVRGQALLVAEAANLLLLRPPKNQGEEAWMNAAMEQKENATLLARHAANRDYDQTRKALLKLADTCNRCHQTFRAPTKIVPFEDPAEKTSLEIAP